MQLETKLVTFVYSWRDVKGEIVKNVGISSYSCINVMDLDIKYKVVQIWPGLICV